MFVSFLCILLLLLARTYALMGFSQSLNEETQEEMLSLSSNIKDAIALQKVDIYVASNADKILTQALLSPCFEGTKTKYNLVYTDQEEVVKQVASSKGNSVLGVVDTTLSALPASISSFPFATNKVDILFNVDTVGSLQLSFAVLASVFEGSITFWDDHRIQALNSHISLPHNQIVVLSRQDSSEDTALLTSKLSTFSRSLATRVGSSPDKPLWCSGRAHFPSDDGHISCLNEVGNNMRVKYVTGHVGMQTAVQHTPFSIGYSSLVESSVRRIQVLRDTSTEDQSSLSFPSLLIAKPTRETCEAHQAFGTCFFKSLSAMAASDHSLLAQATKQWQESCTLDPTMTTISMSPSNVIWTESQLGERFLSSLRLKDLAVKRLSQKTEAKDQNILFSSFTPQEQKSLLPSTSVFQPVGVSSLSLIHSFPSLNLTCPLAASIFSGSISTWNHPALSQLNPNLPIGLKDIHLVLYSPSSRIAKDMGSLLRECSSEFEMFKGSKSVSWVSSEAEAEALVLQTPSSISFAFTTASLKAPSALVNGIIPSVNMLRKHCHLSHEMRCSYPFLITWGFHYPEETPCEGLTAIGSLVTKMQSPYFVASFESIIFLEADETLNFTPCDAKNRLLSDISILAISSTPCTVLDLKATSSNSCNQDQSKTVVVMYKSDANCTTSSETEQMLGIYYMPCDTVAASSVLGSVTLTFWVLFCLVSLRVIILGLMKGFKGKGYSTLLVLLLNVFSVGMVPIQLNFDDSSDTLSDRTCATRTSFIVFFSQILLFLQLHEGIYGTFKVQIKDQLVLPLGVLALIIGCVWVFGGEASKEVFTDYVSLGSSGAVPLERERCAMSAHHMDTGLLVVDILCILVCSMLAFFRYERHYAWFFSMIPHYVTILILMYTYSLGMFETEADEVGFVSLISLWVCFMTLSIPIARMNVSWLDVLLLSNWEVAKKQDEFFKNKWSQGGGMDTLGSDHNEWFESPMIMLKHGDRFFQDEHGEEKSIEMSKDFSTTPAEDHRMPPVQNPGEGTSLSRSDDIEGTVTDAEISADNLLAFNVMTFQEVPSRVLEVIARACKLIHVHENEFLFHAGEDERGMYLLLEGTLQLEQESTKRDSMIGEMRMSAPVYLGELALVSNATHSSNCRAVDGAASVILLSKSAFRTIMYFMAPQQLSKIELKLLKKGITLRTLISQPNMYSEFENIQKNAYAAENIQFAKYATEFHRKYFDLDFRVEHVLRELYPIDTLPNMNKVGSRMKKGAQEKWLDEFLKERWTTEEETMIGMGPTFGDLISGLMTQFNASHEEAELVVIRWCKYRDATRIYEVFIEEGSLSEVNMSTADREAIKTSLDKNEVPLTLFLDAKNQVYLVLMDPFMKFKRTRAFYDVCKDVLKHGGIKTPRNISRMKHGLKNHKDEDLPFDERPALLFFEPSSSISVPLWVSPYGNDCPFVAKKGRGASFFGFRRNVPLKEEEEEQEEEQEEEEKKTNQSSISNELTRRDASSNTKEELKL